MMYIFSFISDLQRKPTMNNITALLIMIMFGQVRSLVTDCVLHSTSHGKISSPFGISLKSSVRHPLQEYQRYSQQHKQQQQRSSSTALSMARMRGLEKNRQSATPTEGGMTLYLKAGPDGTSVGDCPFAHFVRLVLEEKGLEYTVQPCTAETKPKWLVEHYEGKMPALRHRKECYTESSVIGDYLEFFFPEPSLQGMKSPGTSVTEGFFPAFAQYIKAAEGKDDSQLQVLQGKLSALNEHFVSSDSSFLEGDSVSLADCRLMPQLFHLQTAIEGFKGGVPDIQTLYPRLNDYYDRFASRTSFQATLYPKETVLWGWGNARK